jgi:hypothetical protein
MNDSKSKEGCLTYRELIFASQKPDFRPKTEKTQSMLALLNWDFSNPVLKEPPAEQALVEYLEQERQKENILPVVEYHKTENVLDALLMVDWNIDRDGEKVVFDYFRDNISLFGPRIEVLLNNWLDGPDKLITDAKDFKRIAGSVWFQMLEMVNVVARGKPGNCNKVLLRILNDERVPIWFKGWTARALGKLKEKSADEKIIALISFWDSINTLSRFIEAIKDLRAIKALPRLYNLSSNLNQLIDNDFNLVGDWHESKEGIAAALETLIPNQDREKLSDAVLDRINPAREMKKLKKDTEYAVSILEKAAK